MRRGRDPYVNECPVDLERHSLDANELLFHTVLRR